MTRMETSSTKRTIRRRVTMNCAYFVEGGTTLSLSEGRDSSGSHALRTSERATQKSSTYFDAAPWFLLSIASLPRSMERRFRLRYLPV
jgi:hypothetical protein